MKNRLRTIILMWLKQAPISYESLGLLQQNKNFWTPLEQANKMMSRFLLLRPSFTKKETFKKFFQQYAPNVFDALYCKFRLVRLCPVFTDPVTYCCIVIHQRQYYIDTSTHCITATPMHTYIHTYIHTYTHTDVRTDTQHTHTYIHASTE